MSEGGLWSMIKTLASRVDPLRSVSKAWDLWVLKENTRALTLSAHKIKAMENMYTHRLQMQFQELTALDQQVTEVVHGRGDVNSKRERLRLLLYQKKTLEYEVKNTTQKYMNHATKRAVLNRRCDNVREEEHSVQIRDLFHANPTIGGSGPGLAAMDQVNDLISDMASVNTDPSLTRIPAEFEESLQPAQTESESEIQDSITMEIEQLLANQRPPLLPSVPQTPLPTSNATSQSLFSNSRNDNNNNHRGGGSGLPPLLVSDLERSATIPVNSDAALARLAPPRVLATNQ